MYIDRLNCWYGMLNLVSIAFWIWFGCFCDWAMAKLCKFRPSDPFSPRRELQESTQRAKSSISLRRPRWGLGETQSRLGESDSPKRDHDESWYHFSAISRPGERCWALSDGHSRLSESGSPKRVLEVCSCVFCWILV